jgi:hypothetical protein
VTFRHNSIGAPIPAPARLNHSITVLRCQSEALGAKVDTNPSPRCCPGRGER